MPTRLKTPRYVSAEHSAMIPVFLSKSGLVQGAGDVLLGRFSFASFSDRFSRVEAVCDVL